MNLLESCLFIQVQMEKDLSKEEQVQWLCGAAAGQLSCLVLQSFWAGLPEHQGASGFWTLRTGHSLLPTSRCLPRLRTRPAECNSHQGGNYWVNELRGDYEPYFYAIEVSRRVQMQQNMKDLQVLLLQGLQGSFPQTGYMMLFSLNWGTFSTCYCILPNKHWGKENE